MTLEGFELKSPETPCSRCGENPATVRWGDVFAITHGFASNWCERCAVEVQTEHARGRAAALPELERRLVELGGPAKAICSCKPALLTKQTCPVHGEVDFLAVWNEHNPEMPM